MRPDRTFPQKTTIVSSVELENRDFRLDPTRYNEEGERLLRHLKQLGLNLLPIHHLAEFEEIYLPNRFTRIYLENDEHGAPMIGTSSMLMFRLPLNSRIRIEGSLKESLLRVLNGDILVSRSGTVGTTVLCGNSYTDHIASDDCFRVRINKDMRGFVAAYLISVFGQTLLTRDSHGKVIKHLKDKDIGNCLIPIIEDSCLKRINELMLRSVELIDEARYALATAESKLHEDFGIPSVSAEPGLWFERSNSTFLRISDSLFSIRLDPHFHNPDIRTVRELINLPYERLGKIADVWGVARFKRYRADKGYGVPLYSSTDIMRTRLSPSAYLSAERNAKNIKKCRIEKGTILIPCSGAMGGILGRCMLAGMALDGKTVTQHVLRVKVKNPKFITDYVAAVLGSRRYGYPIITSFRYGKDVPELAPEELESIPIPMLQREKQEQVAQHVRLAFSNLDNSNLLENEAQRKLLEALEWDEKYSPA